MTENDTKLIAIRALAAAFDKEPSGLMLEAYLDGLGDLGGAVIQEVCRELIRTAKFFPRVSEIREMASASAGAAGVAAWDQVLVLARDSRRALHPDPVAEEIVRQLGGWLALGQQDINQLTTWTRKEFLELYASGAPRENVTLRLEGRDETSAKRLTS